MAERLTRNYKAIATEISEGFITMNPIYLKLFDLDALKALYNAIDRKLVEIRTEPFPYKDTILIRNRNLKLQRLYGSLVVIKNYGREKRWKLL